MDMENPEGLHEKVVGGSKGRGEYCAWGLEMKNGGLKSKIDDCQLEESFSIGVLDQWHITIQLTNDLDYSCIFS
ncbi:hypothetical protein IEQ34_020654 [Dendrobium chrysotoxum]|uniref:Uncharacterized protein n=1 Tax=Dendrobium chrysotoxum TaxID=161865 RepID=A0AAV7G2N6_DENCH|nr:hypothetical protein IEQ34_020654 [Dendrobium chrysotoxum]